MKKIYLYKLKQKEITFYSMIADPRLIAKVRKKYVAGEVQEVQRPWVEKKVKEISKYVAGKTEFDEVKALGVIPNTPILNFKKPFVINSEKVVIKINGTEFDEVRFYVLFPTSEEEIIQFEDSLEIIDGQHRLIAFDDQFINPSLSTEIVYEMSFMVFENLEDRYRKEIFMVTNEKQDKVAANLIRFLKKSLGLLGTDELIYDLLVKINAESSSPLYKRIVFGYDQLIRKGYSETQLSKIFNKYGGAKILKSIQGNQNEQITRFIKIINNYLEAWEVATNSSFLKPDSETMTKISGLRYLFMIFPDFYNLLIKKEKTATKENFRELIIDFVMALELERAADIFCDGDNKDGDLFELRSLAFRSEGATSTLAKDDVEKFDQYILKQRTDGFDPAAGL